MKGRTRRPARRGCEKAHPEDRAGRHPRDPRSASTSTRRRDRRRQDRRDRIIEGGARRRHGRQPSSDLGQRGSPGFLRRPAGVRARCDRLMVQVTQPRRHRQGLAAFRTRSRVLRKIALRHPDPARARREPLAAHPRRRRARAPRRRGGGGATAAPEGNDGAGLILRTRGGGGGSRDALAGDVAAARGGAGRGGGGPCRGPRSRPRRAGPRCRDAARCANGRGDPWRASRPRASTTCSTAWSRRCSRRC